MNKAPFSSDAIRQSGQARFILAVVCAASLVGATSAHATGNGGNGNSGPKVTRTVTDEQNAPFSDSNPCIGGAIVSGTGHLHTVFIDRSTQTRVDTTYRFQHNGEATNVTMPGDPADYRFRSSGDTDLISSTRNFKFTMKTREHIIRERGNYPSFRKDDYFVSSTYKITGLDPKPVVVRQSSESSCK